MDKVKDIKANDSVSDLVKQMNEAGGFTARKLGIAAEIFQKMQQDGGTKFFSFPACIVSTGTRGVIMEMVKNRAVDVLITTCGTLDHDLARLWRNYYHGDFLADDAKLHKKGINRLGNVFIPNDSYGVILEQKLRPMFSELFAKKKKYSSRELIYEVGKRLAKEKNREESILYWAAKNNIPVFVPGITDGAFGCQLWMYWQDGHKDCEVSALSDEQELAEIIFAAKKTSALMVGGGISKHHTIWWNQFRGGLDYAIQITTAPEWDGSLSGAQVREAVSWGKVKENAKQVTVEGDATVLLPLIWAAVKNKL